MKNRLRQLRKENNLTVRELGEKVKIDYSTISRLETGKTIWNELDYKKKKELMNILVKNIYVDRNGITKMEFIL